MPRKVASALMRTGATLPDYKPLVRHDPYTGQGFDAITLHAIPAVRRAGCVLRVFRQSRFEGLRISIARRLGNREVALDFLQALIAQLHVVDVTLRLGGQGFAVVFFFVNFDRGHVVTPSVPKRVGN
jgi:hypothetical protein